MTPGVTAENPSDSTFSAHDQKVITIAVLAAGIGAGAIIVATVFVLAFCCVRRRRQKRKNDADISSASHVRQNEGPYIRMQSQVGRVVYR